MHIVRGCPNGAKLLHDFQICMGIHWPGSNQSRRIKEADDYCKKQGKVLRVTKTVEIAIKFGSTPAAEVYFKALDPNDPELKQPATIEEIAR